jgi:hypothetical protein
VDTAQTATNAAATELANAKTAKTNAASAPVTMTVAFSATNPTVEQFTSTTQWKAAVATNNQAGTTVATKDGAHKASQANLATAQATQTTLVLRCQCKAKAAYTAAVASAKTHETSNKANWRKAEKLICALDATEPCPSNFPGHPTAPTLPNAVSSKTDNQCATNAPTSAPTNKKVCTVTYTRHQLQIRGGWTALSPSGLIPTKPACVKNDDWTFPYCRAGKYPQSLAIGAEKCKKACDARPECTGMGVRAPNLSTAECYLAGTDNSAKALIGHANWDFYDRSETCN